jgi:hypothetical protein
VKLSRAARSGTLLAALGLAACTAGGHPLPGVGDQFGLGRFPGAQQQIVSYYKAHASEQSRACNHVQMDAITRSKVVSETDSQLVLDLEYSYSATKAAEKLPKGPACDGFSSRTFTFERSSDAYKLLRMSGDSH